MARIVESTNTFTLKVRTNADSLGKMLREAKADTKHILMDVLIRLAISVLAIWIWNREGSFAGIMGAICYAGLLVFTAYPLIHLRDTMQFCENGIKFKNRAYLFRSQQVNWLCRSGFTTILDTTYLCLGGHKKQINASYVREPQGAFAIAYQGLECK